MKDDNNNNKKIILLSTGGTIACRPSERGLAPELSAEDMLDVLNIKGVTAYDLFSMDSSNIQPEEWAIMAESLKAKAKEADGLVLTHGTDTMAYSASMLSFLLRDIEVPVVITGAQRPIVDPDSDGRINLRDAITAARQLEPGVYVCFGGYVMLGCRAVKTHTLSDRAFESINAPYIGAIASGRFYKLNDAPHIQSRYDLNNNIESSVALIKLIPGTSPKLIDVLGECGMRGVCVECFGLGGLHSFRRDHNDSLVRLIEKGIPVVLTSQCLYEPASLDVYAISRTLHDAGAISAGDMTTEAAVTKLMWLLGQTDDMELIREMFNHSFCGEITEKR